jgi:Tol biopolymer transport system component
MKTNGRNKVRLTNNDAVDGYPSWSPGGSQIAFSSDRDGNWEIYVMDADGANQTRVTNTPYNEWRAVWSPDGSKFVISTDHADGVYLINLDGSDLKRLSDMPSINASWTADGTGILFNSDQSGNHEIYLLEILSDMQPGSLIRLTNNSVYDGHPVWIEK